MRRTIVVFSAAALLAGCGSSRHSSKPAAPADPATVLGAGATTLYRRGVWAVVTQGTQAVAVHLVGSSWRADRSGRVKIRIIGPAAQAPAVPQVAAELSAAAALVESGMWVDGKELLEKGGGSAPNKSTIYGVSGRLNPGPHLAVAYARTQSTGTAVAWSFRVV